MPLNFTVSTFSEYSIFINGSMRWLGFLDEIEVMRSVAKPRKITILGDDKVHYMFLGKPKDDLRKDARLMEFNGVINKLLKAGTESRRRQLCEHGSFPPGRGI